MNTPTVNYLHNRNYWIFSGYFFVYFFIMATCFPFLGIWLGDINGLSGDEIGIVFATMSFFAFCFQPIFGFITDKLGLKKYLLWAIALVLLGYAPFFIYVFSPLLKTNVYLGAVVGGAYMGFAFAGGAGASEAYIERASRVGNFEYGRARMFGMFGWGICASLAGILYAKNPAWVFWLGSAGAVVLVILVALARPEASATAKVVSQLTRNKNAVNLKQAFALLKLPTFWALLAYVVGVACTYDIFDQQFGNFFTTFFETKARGLEIFGYVTTMGEFLNACIMFFVPLVINRIGAKNALLIAGSIMSVRIIGSSFATEVWEVIGLKILHMLEVPFYLVGLFKYIADVFEAHFSATIYMVACQFIKQVGNMLASSVVGGWYDQFGYQHTYLFLGLFSLSFTILSFFTLKRTVGHAQRADVEEEMKDINVNATDN